MSHAIHKVAIAGATGQLGRKITEELLKAGFAVTALTRDAACAKAKLPSGANAVSVDYTSHDALLKELRGQDAVISTLGGAGGFQQLPLLDAAIDAGVQRVIPSEFGSDTTSDFSRSLPVFGWKINVQDHLRKRLADNSKTTYTFVLTGAFLDWALEYSRLLDAHKKHAVLVDGGEIPYTSTTLQQIGQGVVGVLKHPSETANRFVRIHGATVTQKGMAALAQKHSTAEGWNFTVTDSEVELQKALAITKTDPTNYVAGAFPQILRVAVGKGMDTNWADHNDNELLGVKPLADSEVDDLVKEYMPVMLKPAAQW